MSENIAFFELQPWEKEYLASGPLAGHHLRLSVRRLTAQSAREAADCGVVSIFIDSRATCQMLERLPALRLISTRSTGHDHLDLEAARQRGVSVCNVPYYGENTVAEHAFGLILGLSRHIFKAHSRTVEGNFSLRGLEGFDLKGKTIGVIGAGAIGLHVIRMARGLGMRALAYDLRPYHLFAEVLGFEYVGLDRLLAESDVITIHVPLTPATRHLIDRPTLGKVKRGSLLINTARGELVDTEALVWALDQGILGGAALDVFEGEQEIREETELLSHPPRSQQVGWVVNALRRENVIFTPHMAFYSREALQRILDTTVQNILGFLEGRPQNLVGV